MSFLIYHFKLINWYIRNYSKSTADGCKKDLKHGPFDVARMIFQRAKNPIPEKIGLFFEDYSLIPKFTFENYPSINPLSNPSAK